MTPRRSRAPIPRSTGVLIMGTVANAMNLLNVDTFYQYVVRGAILLTAVLFDRYGQSRKGKGTGRA